jgi:hypothetical protein
MTNCVSTSVKGDYSDQTFIKVENIEIRIIWDDQQTKWTKENNVYAAWLHGAWYAIRADTILTTGYPTPQNCILQAKLQQTIKEIMMHSIHVKDLDIAYLAEHLYDIYAIERKGKRSDGSMLASYVNLPLECKHVWQAVAEASLDLIGRTLWDTGTDHRVARKDLVVLHREATKDVEQ